MVVFTRDYLSIVMDKREVINNVQIPYLRGLLHYALF
jgi:hypothetical protein